MLVIDRNLSPIAHLCLMAIAKVNYTGASGGGMEITRGLEFSGKLD